MSVFRSILAALAVAAISVATASCDLDEEVEARERVNQINDIIREAPYAYSQAADRQIRARIDELVAFVAETDRLWVFERDARVAYSLWLINHDRGKSHEAYRQARRAYDVGCERQDCETDGAMHALSVTAMGAYKAKRCDDLQWAVETFASVKERFPFQGVRDGNCQAVLKRWTGVMSDLDKKAVADLP